jgi:hypothetical protein
MGTGPFPGVKRPGRGADHPPPSSAEVKKGELYLYPPSRPIRFVTGILYLTIHVARMGESRVAYRIFVGQPEGKIPLREPGRR